MLSKCFLQRLSLIQLLIELQPKNDPKYSSHISHELVRLELSGNISHHLFVFEIVFDPTFDRAAAKIDLAKQGGGLLPLGLHQGDQTI